MLELNDFFGLAIDEDISDIKYFITLIKLKKLIEGTNVVQTLAKQNGRNAAIVNVARRQQMLKAIKPLLNAKMKNYEASFYSKEVTTSSEHDRIYSAEDKLLEFALLVASTKSKKVMLEDPNILTVKQLREAKFLGTRFDRCWEILSVESSHTVTAYRKAKK
ncbi:hypothetical protein ACUR5C_10575 [Aliikangiella sp. IMCC44653]